MKQRMWSFVLICIILWGCQSDRFAWKEFQANQQNSLQTSAWSTNERQLFKSYLSPNQESSFDDDLLSQMMADVDDMPITTEEAKQDVEILFRLLQEAYAGYQYFGGDAIFSILKQDILLAVEQSSAISDDFPVILQSHFKPYIQDGHFVVGTVPLSTKVNLYYDTANTFSSADIAFSSDILRLSPAITNEGKLVYRLTVLSTEQPVLPATLMIQGSEKKLSWAQLGTAEVDPAIAFQETTIQGIPVLSSSHFFTEKAEEDLQALANAGEHYQNQSVFIIDLRGNQGGDSSYAAAFLANYLNEQAEAKILYAQRFSKPLAYFAHHGTGEYRYTQEQADYFQEERSWWMSSQLDGKKQNHDNTIFVLMDQNTASSAETFIQLLRPLANVYLVGSNTRGSSAFGNVCYFFYLPHSNTRIGFGTSMQFFQTMERTEGVGILPDLIVEPEDALDAVVALIQRYKLR